MMQHVDDELLIAYADDPASQPQLEEHLRTCSACWESVSFYRTLNASLREGETWAAEEEFRTGRGQSAVRAFADRISNEDEEARRLLEGVLESPYRFTRTNVISRTRFHTGGVVRRLCKAAREQCDDEPLYAMQLIEAARVIAEALPDQYYPALAVYQLRGQAWKEYATVCQYLGQFQPGLDALRRAEKAYQRLVDPDMGLAAVSLSRAILLWKLQRYSEALPFARASARTYAERRDLKRFVEAQEVEAVILQRLGNSLAARDLYQKAYDISDSLDDLEMKARAARNLGINYRDARDLGTASNYFIMALQIYQALDQQVWIARTQWSIARLPLIDGKFEEAERRLRAVITQFEKKHLDGDATEAKLDLAEALLMLGRLDEVESICIEVADCYRSASMITTLSRSQLKFAGRLPRVIMRSSSLERKARQELW